MSDFNEPVKDYQDYFKDQHARLVSEYFENLVRESKIDEPQNIKTVAELRELESSVADSGKSRKMWRLLRIFCVLVIVGSGVGAYLKKGNYYYLIILAVIALLFVIVKVNSEVSKLNEKVKELEDKRDAKSNEAWAQMAPLNRLHTWHAAQTLFHTSFPEITFDRYVTIDRLRDLQNNFGLHPEFTNGRSVLTTQSGELAGNPFIVAKFLEHWIGSRTYSGSLFIQWTEQVRNDQGNYVTVNRSQTLTATVEKPFPEYQIRNSVILGHEAASNLTFSRHPSKLSGAQEGMLNNWRKDRAVKKVAKQAKRELKSGSGQLTMMSNEEFEALFNAVDRDNEVEFRLLFTPLAQQEMVTLLNDVEAGFGDDFTFSKHGPLNLIESRHLNESRFDCDPRMFMALELAEARRFFNEFQNAYFREIYFAFAPLLTIPLYREKRPNVQNPTGSSGHESSYWEHESIANLLGEDQFRHPDSITRNLLKTTSTSSGQPTSNVTVTAFGYQGFDRVDWVSMRGGDGYIHEVPVNWVEYIPVQRETAMVVGVVEPSTGEPGSANESLPATWQNVLQSNGLSPERALVRGALTAAILGR